MSNTYANPADTYEEGLRKRREGDDYISPTEALYLGAVSHQAQTLKKANPSLSDAEALATAKAMVEDDAAVARQRGQKVFAEDHYRDIYNERGQAKAGDVREAEDAVQAASYDAPTGNADPSLTDLSVDDLKDRLKAQASDVFPDSHHSDLWSDQERAYRQEQARTASATTPEDTE